MSTSLNKKTTADLIRSANNVILVCGSEKAGKSSLIEILNKNYYPNIHHEYMKTEINSKSKTDVECTIINIATRNGDFMLNQKLCLCELSTMDKIIFQKQLAEIIKLCGCENNARVPVIDSINVFTKISAILYVVRDNLIYRDNEVFYSNMFEYFKEQTHIRNGAIPHPIENDEIEEMRKNIASLIEIEKRIAYSVENNNLKWIGSHISLKRVPVCLVVNTAYDDKEMLIDGLLKDYLEGKNALVTLGETEKRMNINQSLTDYYFKQRDDEKEKAIHTERINKYCEILKDSVLEIKKKGHSFGHISTLLELGRLEEIKKDEEEVIELRKNTVMEYKDIDENSIPLNILRNFLPLSNNSYGIGFINTNINPSLSNYIKNKSKDDMLFVCRMRWGDEKEEMVTSSDITEDQILTMVQEIETLKKFKENLENGLPINDDLLSPYVVIMFWLMRCKNENRY